MRDTPYAFRLPDDPVARARLVQKFWAKVAVNTRPGTKCWWWRPRTRLFQAKVAGVKYATKCGRAAWVIVHDEPLGPHDTVVHQCGHTDCVRHLRRLNRTQLTATVRALERKGIHRAEIARRLGVSWSFVDRHGTRHVVDGRVAPKRRVA